MNSAELMGTRPVPAPTIDWLEKADVMKAIGVREHVLNELIADGLFPEGVTFGKRELRWQWEDVAYFLLHQKIASRLKVSATEAEPEANTRRPKQS